MVERLADVVPGGGEGFGLGPVPVEVQVVAAGSGRGLGCDMQDERSECPGFCFGEFAGEADELGPGDERHSDKAQVCWGLDSLVM